MSHPADDHPVRRVLLPNGRTIEVLSLQGAAAAPVEEPVELHVCPACASELVLPVVWEEAGPAHWDVMLRCPNCEWSGGGVFDEDSVERFDAELDRGTEVLVHDLHRLMRANMEDEIERFTRALAADAVLPEDF